MNQIIQRIGNIGIVPVVKIDDVKKAVPLARALCKGGLPAAEITFRVAGAEKSIRKIREEIPEMLVGAGTVLTTEQVDDSIAAGAQFIVSPGLNSKIVEYCQQKNITVIPGCTIPSDIEKVFFARPIWRKLQSVNGETCISKMAKVADLLQTARVNSSDDNRWGFHTPDQSSRKTSFHEKALTNDLDCGSRQPAGAYSCSGLQLANCGHPVWYAVTLRTVEKAHQGNTLHGRFS